MFARRLLAAALLLCPAVHASQGVTMLSVNNAGASANKSANVVTLSADGRFAAFDSYATNLAPGAPYVGSVNVYVRDRMLGVTQNVTAIPGPPTFFDGSFCPVISADGRYVVFVTNATSSLVPGATVAPFDLDIVRFDRLTLTYAQVNLDSSGQEATGSSRFPAISANGRFVVFEATASDLVPNDNNGHVDIFVRDMVMGTTERVSKGLNGAESNGDSQWSWISADGRHVAFSSFANNLVPNDTNAAQDVFRYDRQTGVTVRVSVGDQGQQGNGASFNETLHFMSPNGRYVGFASLASNLVPGDTNGLRDAFVRDVDAQTTTLVSAGMNGAPANNVSRMPSPSDDGRYVSFTSVASNLVSGDTNGNNDVFRRDLVTGVTRRITVNGQGQQANQGSDYPSIYAGGRRIAFNSFASNLVPGDTVDLDVFLFEDCWLDAFLLGPGTAGTGGVTPGLVLAGGSCDRAGGSLEIVGGLGQATGLLFVGLGTAATAFPGGTFLVDLGAPYAAIPIALGGAAGAPGAGSTSLPWLSPLNPLAGTTLFMQGVIADPGAAGGAALSLALRVNIG